MTHIWYMLEPPAQFFYIEIAYIQYICSIFFLCASCPQSGHECREWFWQAQGKPLWLMVKVKSISAKNGHQFVNLFGSMVKVNRSVPKMVISDFHALSRLYGF